MKFLKGFELNIEVLFKVLLLSGFSVFFILLIFSEQSYLYVHPKMIKYIIFGIVVMSSIVMVTVTQLFKIPRQRMKKTPYILFLCTLMIAFVFPPIALDASSLSGRDINLAKRSGGDIQIQNDKQEEMVLQEHTDAIKGLNTQNEAKVLERLNDTIILNDENFAPWLFELYAVPKQYVNKEISLEGFVFKREDFAKDEFVAARLIMVCCAADMQVNGLLCKYDDAQNLKQDQWVRIKGTLSVEIFMEEELPIIHITSLEKIEKPQVGYVYPF